MKRGLIYMVLMLLMGARIAAHAQELTVSDIQNSGCMRDREYGRRRANAEGEPTRTIILTKEGDALYVQLLNYVENCGTSGFDVTPSMSGGSDGTPCSVAVSVEPVIFADADCDCPYNVSFTVHGLEANSFLFSCWWCEGMVTLTDGEPLVLEDVWEDVSIEDLGYKIHEVMHSAQLTGGKSWEGELNIPSEVNYEGQKYVVTNIGYNAFVDNTALTSVTIPNTVLSIGSGAFARCTGLTSIVIPEGVKSLGHNVFSGCTNLASITIPNSVIQIGGSVFNGTAWYDNQPDGVIYAGRMAYTYKGTMPEGTQIDIKEGTIAIANNAFCRCDNLTSVTIPGSVSTIGYDAFWRCNNLKTVIISEGVKRIEHAAFSNCTSLKSIVIPESVTHIGEYAFMECTALTSATINGAITRMGRWAFGGCTALYSLSISQNVKDIGNETFSNCTSLYRVKIPGSVTRLGDGSFYRCSNLYSVQIFEGVEAIGYSAFGECNNMSYVILPNSLTKIDDYAFYNCSKLADVYCYADSVPKTANNWVFYDSPIASATLHVPAGSVDAYRTTSPWSGFGNIVALPIEINETTFPDENFRNWVLAQSYGQDEMLTDEEIVRIKEINVISKSIKSLKGIEFFTELTNLDCSWNQLPLLDVSKNTALKELNCQGNQLTELNLLKNIELEDLACNYNQLTSLDVSQNSALAILACIENQLTELDLSRNNLLKRLVCPYNQLTSINVSGCTALESFRCAGNKLAELDVSGCPALEDLICMSNQIRGEAMDALVESLPTVNRGHLGVINHTDEQNVMTKSQVAVAKAKGWYVQYNNDRNQWKNYEGSDDPTGITSPLRETAEGAIFDLQGRKLQGKPAQGIYIENGQKILIK